MTLTLHNARIVTPDGIIRGGLASQDGRITEIGASLTSTQRTIDLEDGYLLPGFIDTQVNGGNGVLFNDTPTVDGIDAIGRAHRRFGTTGFLPTLISDELDIIDAAMRATETAVAQGVPGVIGIHIEGPFISKDRKGIHNPELFRVLDTRSKTLLKSLSRGKTLVTLAPENCTLEDITELTEAGVIVAAGHTNASFETAKGAFAAGVTGITHLFNAMSPMSHRAPGVVGAALDDQTVYCGLITDGHHVDWPVLRIAMRSRPIDRFLLVTDAMPTVGSTTKSFRLNGRRIHVEDGVCIDDHGTLAGSDLDMATAVRNVVTKTGRTLVEAALMAATAPARFLGVDKDHGTICVGKCADLVWLDADLMLRGVFLGGQAQEPLAHGAV